MIWILKLIGLFLVVLSLICLIFPHKVFTWREKNGSFLLCGVKISLLERLKLTFG
jgi:hypothetical protein